MISIKIKINYTMLLPLFVGFLVILIVSKSLSTSFSKCQLNFVVH